MMIMMNSTAMVEDGGLFACTAKNRAGVTVHSARLNIYGKYDYMFYTVPVH